MRGIGKRYGSVQANAGIDLDVQAGSVLGLLGENGSGKSTLMKILFGMVPADAGSILFKGRELAGHTPREAIDAGIGMIHQHFMLIDAMTVAENVLLGLKPDGLRLRKREIAQAIRATSRSYGLELDPDARVRDLPLGRRQRVEIVKALMRGADLLILDEPTSNLSPLEVDGLLGVVRRLRDEGKAIIFISHKLGEVLEICDRVAVLRDGRLVGEAECKTATRGALATLMVGRDLSEPFQRSAAKPRAPLLELLDVTATPAIGGTRLRDISLSIGGGEILAIAGVDGNGQLELAETVAGLRRTRHGAITVDGADMTRSGVSARMAAGVAYIPSDRLQTSLVPSMSVAENMILRDARRAPFSRRGWFDRDAVSRNATEAIEAFAIRAPSPDIAVKRLSGGNQQKIVVAREVARKPKVLVALQATWGLDPGATRLIIEQLLTLRDAGVAILYISSELEEVLALGDRVGVMFDGQLIGIVPRAEADIAHIGLMMAGTGVADREGRA
jgi:simple sugar transport system ATP-binding protein